MPNSFRPPALVPATFTSLYYYYRRLGIWTQVAAHETLPSVISGALAANDRGRGVEMKENWKSHLRETTLVDQIPGLGVIFDIIMGYSDDPEVGHVMWAHFLILAKRISAVRLVVQSATDNDLPSALNDIAYLLKEQKQYKKAAAVYKKAIELNPVDPKLHNGLGNAFRSQKRYRDAENIYRKSIKLDPECHKPYNGLGNALLYQNRYKEADAAYKKAICLRPQAPNPYNGLGSSLWSQKRYEEAEAIYIEAIQLHPRFLLLHNGLGNVLRSQKRYEEAEAAYNKAISINFSDPLPHNSLGNLLHDQKRYREAEVAYSKAISIDSEFPAPYHGLGNLLICQARYDEAEVAYSEAIKRDPVSPLPYYGLGDVLCEQMRYDEAEVAYSRAIELDSSSPLSHYGMGKLPRVRENVDLYVDNFEKFYSKMSQRRFTSIKDGNSFSQFVLEYVGLMAKKGFIKAALRVVIEGLEAYERWASLGPSHCAAMRRKAAVLLVEAWLIMPPSTDVTDGFHSRPGLSRGLPDLNHALTWLEEAECANDGGREAIATSIELLTGWVRVIGTNAYGRLFTRRLLDDVSRALYLDVPTSPTPSPIRLKTPLAVPPSTAHHQPPSERATSGLRLAQAVLKALVVMTTEPHVNALLDADPTGAFSSAHDQFRDAIIAVLSPHPAAQTFAHGLEGEPEAPHARLAIGSDDRWAVSGLRAQLAISLFALPAGARYVALRPLAPPVDRVMAWARHAFDGFGREYVAMVRDEAKAQHAADRHLGFRLRSEAVLRTFLDATLLTLSSQPPQGTFPLRARLTDDGAARLFAAVQETRALSDLYQTARLDHGAPAVSIELGEGITQRLFEHLDQDDTFWLEVAATWHHHIVFARSPRTHIVAEVIPDEGEQWRGMTTREATWGLIHASIHEDLRGFYHRSDTPMARDPIHNDDLNQVLHDQKIVQLRDTLTDPDRTLSEPLGALIQGPWQPPASEPLSAEARPEPARLNRATSAMDVLTQEVIAAQRPPMGRVLFSPDGVLHDLPWSSMTCLRGSVVPVVGQCLSGPALIRSRERERVVCEGVRQAVVVVDRWYLRVLDGEVGGGALALGMSSKAVRSDLKQMLSRLRGWDVRVLVADESAAANEPFARWFHSPPGDNQARADKVLPELLAPELVVWLTHGAHAALLLGCDATSRCARLMVDAHRLMRCARGAEDLRLPAGLIPRGGPTLDLSRCRHFLSGACAVGRIDIEGAHGLDGVGLVRALIACGVRDLFMPHWPVSVERVTVWNEPNTDHAEAVGSFVPIGVILNRLVLAITKDKPLPDTYRKALTELSRYIKPPQGFSDPLSYLLMTSGFPKFILG